MTGDQTDFAARIRAALPARWFPDDAPVLASLLAGLGSAWASLYDLLVYMRQMARIATATGTFLDFIAVDYFALDIQRLVNESDTAFRRRIIRELLRPKATRAAVIRALVDLTGREPIIFEPARPGDTGGWGSLGMVTGSGLGYGVAGGYGSLMLPFQAFITAYRPTGGGIADVGGYWLGSGWAGGGYGVGALEWASEDMVQGQVTDAQIYDAIARTIPAATIAWTRITT